MQINAILFFFIIISLLTLISGEEFIVSSHPSLLHLSPNQSVANSPGTHAAAILACNRVRFRALSRIRNLNKFFHSLKLAGSVTQIKPLFCIQTVELCLHRNASLGIGMCSAGDWWSVSKKGSFARSLSPFEDWILDVRVLPDPARVVEVRSGLEFLPHRVVFLVLGFCSMMMAGFISESVTFYYGGAMTTGIILVLLIVLYQGMKLLPTGRKSSLALVMYSSIVGVAASLFRHISVLLRAALVEIGIYEDMHKPVSWYSCSSLSYSGWSMVWILGCSQAGSYRRGSSRYGCCLFC